MKVYIINENGLNEEISLPEDPWAYVYATFSYGLVGSLLACIMFVLR